MAQKEYQGAIHGKHLDFDPLYQHAVVRGGPQVKSLLDKYIVGNDPMTVNATLEALGLEFTENSDDSDYQIIPEVQAEEESQAFRNVFFKQKKNED